MTKKMLLIPAFLCLALSAGTKQYSISFAKPVEVGSVKLAAGDYKVKVDGAHAVFTENRTRKSFTAPVKIEKQATKPQFTAVESKDANGVEHVDAIDIGGADFKLVF
jgi:hypothetical protein